MPLSSLNFKFPWRSYQSHFLAHFQEHIQDGHLHVVAPPGSGKTLLGLEMVRQLNQKTLVLAPTLTIRNQWHDRFQQFFTQNGDFVDLSFDLEQPKSVTFTTYQSLYAFYKKHAQGSDYLGFFEKEAFGTIVLDEAHHLKKSWWAPLFALKQHRKATMVSLTATPPYDSPQHEIDKYFELCGPIDDEIAVPDLIREKDLCPHQDFIHFSAPEEALIQRIAQFRVSVADLVDALATDSELVTHAENHPFIKNTEEYLEAIYKTPSLFSSFLIYLHAAGKPVSAEKYALLGFEKKETPIIPPWNREWATTFLNTMLFDKDQPHPLSIPLRKRLVADLRAIGAYKQSRVDLVGEVDFYRQLSSSPAKLNSIIEICSASQKSMKDELRAVILTDYIRKEFLDQNFDDSVHFGKLGAVPIFQALRTKLEETDAMAILTGSLVVVSQRILQQIQVDFPHLRTSGKPLETDSNFVVLDINGGNPVGVLTQLFQEGHIKILIGTKALLGEGWDAPALNTLILASFVGSFVSSNQMRGRAIRTFGPKPNKTAVIWHLCCLDYSDENGGVDMQQLQRRFSAFMGVSQNEPVYVENGWERLGLELPQNKAEMAITNRHSITLSEKRDPIRQLWVQAINKPGQLYRELISYLPKQKRFKKEKQLRIRDLVQYGITQLVLAVILFIPEFVVKNAKLILTKGWLTTLYTLIGVLFVGYGYRTFKVAKAYLYFGKIHTHIEKMGWTILYTFTKIPLWSLMAVKNASSVIELALI